MKNNKKIILYLSALLIAAIGQAQFKGQKISIPKGEGVAWWSGISNHGHLMPMQNGYTANLDDNYGNQVQSLLLSSDGQVIWSESPFKIVMNADSLTVTSNGNSPILHENVGGTIKDGFKYASKKWFPASGTMPDELLFSAPQYNTWIELMYDQNEEDIYEYANQIIANGFPPGVLMIDDNWQQDYGQWDFKKSKFNNPKAMIDSLHESGFKVMLWVCPMISPDSEVYRELASRDYLLKDQEGRPAIVRWWNGASAILDLSNEGASAWFKGQLDQLQMKYGVDGFKFDAGDFEHYQDCYSGSKKVSPQEQCKYYAEIGLDYPLNEYRAMWQMAGHPLVNRLRDKAHNWNDLEKLVPDMLALGLSGYNFTCPDMIGGGEFTSFLNNTEIDQELIVRSAQCHALMPMMQFSVAPWRILDKDHLKACKEALNIRDSFRDLILELARTSSVTGEPIIRSMDYVFPNMGYEDITSQFLLGDDLLVAPVQEKGAKNLNVVLPPGLWKDAKGNTHVGGRTLDVYVTLNTLPYFVKS